MSADPTAHLAPQGPSLGRRALVTRAAVLGAARVASIANASDARVADGSTMKVGRRNQCDARTSIYTSSYFEVDSNENNAINATSRGAVDRSGQDASPGASI